jgi:hypothetical protein
LHSSSCPPPRLTEALASRASATPAESARQLKRISPLNVAAALALSAGLSAAETAASSSSMDLRLPPLPPLPPPNLISGTATGASTGRVVSSDAAANSSISAPEQPLPAYMHKLLQLQKLQEQASFPAVPEPLAPASPFASSGMQQPVSLNTLFDVSGADLIASQSLSGAQQQRAAASGSSASVSLSFEEVDEQ